MPLRLLIADDSATNRLLFSTTVARMGHHADVVATGREAIDLFLKNRYDLVFLDINMPALSGVETAGEIQRINASHTPVYGISGWIDPDTEDQLLRCGVRDCLIKPLDRTKLESVICACHLENQPAADISAAPQDIPPKLLAVYADELRARAAACQRYYAAADIAGIMRETHTLRALADMLKTPSVERAAGVLESHCRRHLQSPDDPEKMQTIYHETLQDMTRACHSAARAIERMM